MGRKNLVFLQLFVFILNNGKDEMLTKVYLMKGAALNVQVFGYVIELSYPVNLCLINC